MILGVDPKIDFAFKRLFGSAGNEDLLLSLLNAVLAEILPSPIVRVELLDPFTMQETIEDKLSVLDVKATDDQDRVYNVELQMRPDEAFPGRGLYYWSKMFWEQLGKGDEYDGLRQTISILFVNGKLFPFDDRYHLRFRLHEEERHEIVFSPLLEIHLVELPKFVAEVDDLHSMVEQWIYFLRRAESMEMTDIVASLPDIPAAKATKVLRSIVENPVENQLYEARLKSRRDYNSGIRSAMREGREEGLKLGREVGLQEGQRGQLIRFITRFCGRLAKPPITEAELQAMPLDDLQALNDRLEAEIDALLPGNQQV